MEKFTFLKRIWNYFTDGEVQPWYTEEEILERVSSSRGEHPADEPLFASLSFATAIVELIKEFDSYNENYKDTTGKDNPKFVESVTCILNAVYGAIGTAVDTLTKEVLLSEWPLMLWFGLKMNEYLPYINTKEEAHNELRKLIKTLNEQIAQCCSLISEEEASTLATRLLHLLQPDNPLRDALREVSQRYLKNASEIDNFTLFVLMSYQYVGEPKSRISEWRQFWSKSSFRFMTIHPELMSTILLPCTPFMKNLGEDSLTLATALVEEVKSSFENQSWKDIAPKVLIIMRYCAVCKTESVPTFKRLQKAIIDISNCNNLVSNVEIAASWLESAVELSEILSNLAPVHFSTNPQQQYKCICEKLIQKLVEKRIENVLSLLKNKPEVVQRLSSVLVPYLKDTRTARNLTLSVIKMIPNELLSRETLITVLKSRPNQTKIEEYVQLIESYSWGESIQEMLEPLQILLTQKRWQDVRNILHHCKNYSDSIMGKHHIVVVLKELDGMLKDKQLRAYVTTYVNPPTPRFTKLGLIFARAVARGLMRMYKSKSKNHYLSEAAQDLKQVRSYNEFKLYLVIEMTLECSELIKQFAVLPEAATTVVELYTSKVLDTASFDVAWEHYEEAIQKLKNVITETLTSPFDDVPKSKLKSLNSSLPVISRISEKLSWELPALMNFEKALIEIDNLEAQYAELKKLREWLRRHKVPLPAVQPLPDDPTLETLRSLIEECGDIGLDQSLRETAMFFISRASCIFEAIAEKRLQNAATMSVEDAKSLVHSTVMETTAFLGRIQDETKLKMVDFYEFLSLQNEYFRKDSQKRDRADIITTALEAHEFQRALCEKVNSSLSVWQEFGVFAEEANLIRSEVQKITPDTAISEVKAIKARLAGYFGDAFKPYHLRVFETLGHEGKCVVEFFKDHMSDFQATVNRLTSEVQAYHEGRSLLNVVIKIHQALSPFFEAVHLKRNIRLAAVCKAIAVAAKTEQDVNHLVDSIQTAATRITNIKFIFSLRSQGLRLETLSAYIDMLMETGYYTSIGKLALQPNAGSLLFYYDKDVSIDLSVLNNVVLSARVFISKQEEGKKQSNNTASATDDAAMQEKVAAFLRVHDLAHIIHSLHLKLEQIGHPMYSGEILTMPKKLITQAYETLSSTLKEHKRAWLDAVKIQVNACPRLMFLDGRRLAKFIRAIGSILTSRAKIQGDLIPESLVTRLMPFIVCCFPEVAGKPNEIVYEVVKKAISKLIESDAPEEKGAAPLLERSTALIKFIADSFDDIEFLPTQNSKVEVEIVRALQQNGYDRSTVFHLLFEQNDLTLIHPSHILWCTSNTFSRDLDNFIRRAQTFGEDNMFYVVGVNLLPVKLRRKLLNIIGSLYTAQDQQSTLKLRLVFTDTTGLDVFSWLPQIDLAAQSLTALKGKQLTSQSAITIAKIEVIQGAPGSGKSHSIRHKLADLERSTAKSKFHIVTVSINEDWTVASFLKEFEKLFAAGIPDDVSVGIHFNVSAYAPYDIVDVFFYNFIFFGLIWDINSGDIAWVPRKVKFFIFVELSEAPPEDEGFRSVSNKDLVFNSLPSLRYTATRIQDCIYPLRFKKKWLQALAIVHMWERGAFVNASLQPLLKSFRSLTADEAANYFPTLLQRLESANLGLPKQNAYYACFLDLLAFRMQWLMNMANVMYAMANLEYRLNYHIALTYNGLQEIIGHFIRESAIWAQRRVDLNIVSQQYTSMLYCMPPHDGNVGEFDIMLIAPHPRAGIPPKGLTDHVLKLDSPTLLRTFAARAIGMHNTADMALALERERFVLTPDIAYKLLLVHERCEMKRNLIMSGATGVGKTQLFEFYAAARNISAPLILLFEIVHNFKLNVAKPFLSAESLAELNNSYLNKILHREDNKPVELFKQAIRYVCNDKSNWPEDEEEDEENNVDLFNRVATTFIRQLAIILDHFPLLEQTTEITRIKRCYIQLMKGEIAHQNICNNVNELCDLAESVLTARFVDVFHRILMHPGITAAEFKDKIRKIEASANNIVRLINERRKAAEAIGVKKDYLMYVPTVVVFIDEYNTTSVMGIVKEVLADHSLDGKKLSKHLFFIGAMNPYTGVVEHQSSNSTSESASVLQSSTQRVDYTGVKNKSLEYVVRPCHASLNSIVLDFGNFESWHELQFVTALCEQNDKYMPVRDIILRCQEFVRAAQLHNIKVSIRDILRALHLLDYFNNSEAGEWLLNLVNVNIAPNKRAVVRYWRSVIIAISIAYYFRLPACSATTPSLLPNLRAVQLTSDVSNTERDPEAQQKLLKLLGDSLHYLEERQKGEVLTNSSVELELLFFVLEQVLQCSLKDKAKFFALLDETLPKFGPLRHSVSQVLQRAQHYMHNFGLPAALRLWALTSFQAGTLRDQLQAFLSKKSSQLYPANSLIDRMGDVLLDAIAKTMQFCERKSLKIDVSFDLRQLFIQKIEPILIDELAKRKISANDIITNRTDQPSLILRVLDDCSTNLFNSADIPAGIACTDALRYNFFTIVACVDAKVPLTLLGPAGCSKTLSFVLAEENMKGSQSKSELFTHLKRAHIFRYQCSPYSTDAQVEATFQSAIERQSMIARPDGTSTDICCVMIDEAGLPPEEQHPLKVLHFHTEKPRVSSVIITNTILDAAKTNRTALLQLPAVPPAQDLMALAKAALLNDTSSDITHQAIVQGLCRAFQQANDYSGAIRAGLFQQRDFVYFLRRLRKLSEHNGIVDEITPENLLSALRRNFGGIPTSDFVKLVECFFEQINRSLQHITTTYTFDPPEDYRRDRTIETLIESLEDRTGLEDGNTNSSITPWRYIVLFDPTDSETAVSLLSRLLKRYDKRIPLRICAVSDFAGDANDTTKSYVIANIREAMAEGETVLLINSGPIRTNFYDVFNRYFSRITGNETGTFHYYANVAVGTQSQPCAVHPNFKVIVHIPMSELPTCPLPFLDRFEKYILSVQQLLDVELAQINKPLSIKRHGERRNYSYFDIIHEGVSHMVQNIHQEATQGRLLCNFDARESEASLILDIIETTRATRSSNPVVVGPLKVPYEEQAQAVDDTSKIEFADDDNVFLPTETEEQRDKRLDTLHTSVMFDSSISNNDRARARTWIRTANLRLLQLARPEAVFNCRKLPSAYVLNYIVEQEHFNLMRFMQHAIVQAFGGEYNAAQQNETGEESRNNVNQYSTSSSVDIRRKWCIYTRSSDQLLLVDTPDVNRAINQWFEKNVLPHCPRLSKGAFKTLTLGETRNLSAKECEQIVKEFAQSCTPDEPKILICVADMQTTTRCQLNFLRNTIDHYVTSENALVFVVLHFPSELLFSTKSKYAPIYLNNWDYVYIDSLGFIDSITVDLKESGDQQPALEHDTRPWLAWAFGIRTASITPESIMTAMEGIFFDLIEHYCVSAYFPQVDAKVRRALCNKARQFYTAPPRHRSSMMKNLFKEERLLYSKTVKRYARVWTGTLVHDVVQQASESILSGKLVGSFLRIVHSSLRDLMKPLVAQTFRNLVAYYNMDAIYRAIETKNEQHLRLIRIFADAVDMPSNANLLERSASEAITAIPLKNVATMPYFDLIVEEVMRQISVIRRSNKDLQQIDIIQRVMEKFKTHAPVIARAIDYINSYLLTEFIENFIRCTLGMKLDSALQAIAVAFMYRLSTNVVSVCDTKYSYSKTFVLFQASSAAVKKLIQEVPEFNVEHYINIVKQSSPSDDTIVKITALLTVDVLYQALRRAVAEQNAELMKLWIASFRTMRVSISNRHQLLTSLPADKIIQLEVMSAVFLFVLNSSARAQQVLQTLQHERTREPLQSFNLNLWDITKTENPGHVRVTTADLVNFGIVLFTTHQELHGAVASKRMAYYVQDLCALFLLDAPPEDKQRDGYTALKGNLRWFLSIFFNDKESQKLRALLPQAWRARMLQAWMTKATPSWRLEGQRIAAHLILKHHKKQLDYKFDPHLLLNSLSSDLKARLEKLECPLNNAHIFTELSEPTELEMILYHIFLADANTTGQLDTLARDYREKSPTEEDTPEDYVWKTLNQAAVATAMLNIAASVICNSSCKLDTLVCSWPQETVIVLKNILGTNGSTKAYAPNGRIKNAQAYFLQRLDGQHMVEFLKSPAALNRLGMGSWIVTSDVQQAAMSKFSFIYERNTPESGLYCSVEKALINADANLFGTLMQQAAQDEQKRYQLRAMIVLAIYNNFFSRNMACEFYKQQEACGSTKALAFNGPESTAVQFIANGPANNPGAEELLALFSKQAYEPGCDIDTSIADLLVNVLCVALGSPPESNHLYTRIFRPQVLSEISCPGSDYSRQNKDCGFKVVNGSLTNDSKDIMENNTICRLALNVMTWASWCWPLLLGTKQQHEEIANVWSSPRLHFLNYVPTESNETGSKIKGFIPQMRAYILRRVIAFLHMLNGEEKLALMHGHGMHYVTESLLLLWKELLKPNRDSRLKNTKTFEEAKAYESKMKQIFDTVFANYRTLREAYLTSAAAASSIKVVLDVQSAMSNKLASPLVPFELVKSQITSNVSARMPFLDQFLHSLPSFRVLKYIPRFVSFYEMLNHMFGGRLTKEDLLRPVLECLNKIRDLESEHTIATFMQQWEAFVRDWADCRLELQSLLPVCGYQARNRAFETEIIAVNEQTPLVALISEPNNPEATDAIIRVIDSIDIQRTILRLRNKKYSCTYCNNMLNNAYTYPCCKLSCCEQCFKDGPEVGRCQCSQPQKAEPDPQLRETVARFMELRNQGYEGDNELGYHQLNLDGVLFEDGDMETIYTSQLPSESACRWNFFGSDWSEKEWQTFFSAHVLYGDPEQASVPLHCGIPLDHFTVDFDRIERQMLEKSAGKVDIEGKQFRTPFKCIDTEIFVPEQLNSTSSAIPSSPSPSAPAFERVSELQRYSPAMCVDQLQRLARRIVDGSKLASTPKNSTQIDKKFHKASEEALHSMARMLLDTLTYLERLDSDLRDTILSAKTLAGLFEGPETRDVFRVLTYGGEAYKELYHKLKNEPLGHLKYICLTVVEHFKNNEYIFSELADEYNQRPSPEVISALENIEKYVLEQTSKERKQHIANILKILLSELQPSAILSVLDLSYDTTPLKMAVHYLTIGGQIPANDLAILLPDCVQTKHYGYYLRKIFRICGELELAEQRELNRASCSTSSQETNTDVYVEMVPDELREVKLDASEPVPLPTSERTVPNERISVTPASVYMGAAGLYTSEDVKVPDFESASVTQRNKPLGIPNPGNLCYLNATIQCLLAVPPLRAVYLDKNKSLHFTELADLARAMWTDCQDNNNNDWAMQDYVDVQKCLEVKRSMARLFPTYNSNDQKDAHECLVRMLNEKIEKDAPDIFPFKLKQQVKCLDNAHCTETAIEDSVISLNIPHSDVSLIELLKQSWCEEEVELRCEQCECRKSRRSFAAASLPPTLIFHLKRYALSGWSRRKLDYIVHCPLVLRIDEELITSPAKPTNYRLVAICQHTGLMDGGHYTAYVCNQNQWFFVDDQYVKDVGQMTDVHSSTAYLLFYVREDLVPAPPITESTLSTTTTPIPSSTSSLSSPTEVPNVAGHSAVVPTTAATVPQVDSSAESTLIAPLSASTPLLNSPSSVLSASTRLSASVSAAGTSRIKVRRLNVQDVARMLTKSADELKDALKSHPDISPPERVLTPNRARQLPILLEMKPTYAELTAAIGEKLRIEVNSCYVLAGDAICMFDLDTCNPETDTIICTTSEEDEWIEQVLSALC